MFGEGHFQVRFNRAEVVVFQAQNQVDVVRIGVLGISQHIAKGNGRFAGAVLMGLPHHILEHLVLGALRTAPEDRPDYFAGFQLTLLNFKDWLKT